MSSDGSETRATTNTAMTRVGWSLREQAANWITYNSKSKGAERCVMYAIAMLLTEHRYAWASVPYIAARANVHPRSVPRATANLVEAEELEVLLNEGPNGTSLYVLTAFPMVSKPRGSADGKTTEGVSLAPNTSIN